MADRLNFPVLISGLPLFHVTSFILNEGYKTANIAGSSIVQMIAPTTKTITIEALLIKEFRLYRPILEGFALASRVFAAATGPLARLVGVPVIAKSGVHLDMQITGLIFTQDNQLRDTLKVSMTLTHVPRSQITGIIGGIADVGVAVGTAFI